jgi:hypothetical protein
MSAFADPNQLVTVTLGWREPNGQVVQFGGAGSSAAASTPAAASSGSSSFSDQGDDQPAGGSNAIDLFA